MSFEQSKEAHINRAELYQEKLDRRVCLAS
jgi:hypothetical protein